MKTNPLVEEAIRAHATGWDVSFMVRGLGFSPYARNGDDINVLGGLVEIKPRALAGNRTVFLADDVAGFSHWMTLPTAPADEPASTDDEA